MGTRKHDCAGKLPLRGGEAERAACAGMGGELQLLTHWKTLGEDFGKMGVHARLLDGFDAGAVEVRLVDGASW